MTSYLQFATLMQSLCFFPLNGFLFFLLMEVVSFSFSFVSAPLSGSTPILNETFLLRFILCFPVVAFELGCCCYIRGPSLEIYFKSCFVCSDEGRALEPLL